MEYILKLTNWDKDKEALSIVRRKVFIEEQKVPEEMEWDEFDKDSIHVLVTDKHNSPIACGRIKKDGHIGRMAVLNEYRHLGIGTDVLQTIITEAKKLKLNSVYLHAQITALGFYQKQGFEISSEEFMDAGIPHKSMKLAL